MVTFWQTTTANLLWSWCGGVVGGCYFAIFGFLFFEKGKMSESSKK
jgi:hypothetical protein